MIKILFVDDESAILEGLENRLRPLRNLWEIRFAASGAQALEQLEQQSADVIVSDMLMPTMDGAQLLEKVRTLYPETLRFILSGETRLDGALRAMTVAHQVLTKPCEAALLQRVVEHSYALQQRQEVPAVRQAINVLRSLPALPRLYHELVSTLNDPRSNSALIASIVEEDVGMTARILQIANSALYSPARKVRHAQDAITLLGLMPIKVIALTLHLFRAMDEIGTPKGFSLDKLQQHSLQTAQIASTLLRDPEECKAAFSAGMLHDIGYLLLAVSLPEQWAAARERAALENKSMFEVETEILGCNHADVGGQMLTLWDLPANIIEAVTYHHHPAFSGEMHFGVVCAIHLADALAHAGNQPLEQRPDLWLDRDFLGQVGGLAILEQWQPAPARPAG